MQQRIFVVILAALSMLGALSIDAYLPALPTIATEFSSTLPATQQTLTVFLFAFAFMSLFYGTLSDSFGRRRVILISLGCYFVSTFGAACTTSLGWLFFFRLLQGLSAGAGSVIGRAIVGDLFTGAEAQKIMAYTSVVFGLAPALAPILGGWVLAILGWRSIFFFIALFSFLLWMGCVRWLPESLAMDKRHPFEFRTIVSRYIEVGSNLRFMFRSSATALMFVGITVYVAAAPVYIVDLLHLTVKDFGWFFIPFVTGMTLGSAASGHLSHRFKPNTLINAGYVIMALSVLWALLYTAFFACRVPWAVMPHFFFAFGMAVASPAMTVLTLEMFPHVKGLPASLQGFLFMVIFAIVSGCVAPLLFASAFHLAMGAALGLALSFLLWKIGSRGESEHGILTEEEQPLTKEAPHL